MVTNGTSNASLCLMPVNKKKTNSEITENVNYIKIIIFLLRQLFISTILIYIYIYRVFEVTEDDPAVVVGGEAPCDAM